MLGFEKEQIREELRFCFVVVLRRRPTTPLTGLRGHATGRTSLDTVDVDVGALVCWHAGMPASRCAGAPVRRCVGVPVLRKTWLTERRDVADRKKETW